MALAITVILGFFLTPFVVHSLGRTGYGIWVLVGSFIGYYGLLNLGVSSAMTRYIARYSAQGDSKALNEVASTALTMFVVTGALGVLLSVVLAPVLADFFQVAEDQRAVFIRLLWMIGIATGIGFPSGVLGSLVTAREHFLAANILAITRELLRAGLTVLFLTLGWGLLGIGLAPLVSTVVGILSNIILARIFAGDVKLRLMHANLKTLGMLLLYGGVTTVIAIADIMRSNLDSFVIAKWIGLSSVGIYGIAAAILHYVVRLITTGTGVLTPRFAALEGKGDREQLQQLLAKALAISSFLSFGACMAAIVFGKQFILWWVGGEFAGAVPILWILATGSAFALAQSPSIAFMYAVNKHHFYAIATILEAIANLSLSIILAYRYGIVGVALGTLIPMLIVKIVVMPLYVSRIAGMTFRQYLMPMLPPAAVAISVFLAAWQFGIVTREPSGFGNLVLQGCVAVLLYFVAWASIMRCHNPELLASLLPSRFAPAIGLPVRERAT